MVDQKLHKIFNLKKITYIHKYESKPFIHKYAKILIYIASKSAYNQNNTKCNTTIYVIV